MPKCKNWTLQLENATDICLIVNGVMISDLLSDKKYNCNDGGGIQSSVVESILDDDNDNIKVTVDNREFSLSCEKLESTTVLGRIICDKKSLLDSWNIIDRVLKRISNEEAVITGEESVTVQSVGTSSMQVSDGEQSLHSTYGDENETSNSKEVDEKDFNQRNVFEAIKAKSVGKHYLDVLNLKTPPSNFKVRQRNDDFVETIAQRMVEKGNISIDNASNVIAFINVDKSVFKEEMLKECVIYVIDGNHNIRAQKIAFERTKDWIFRYRMVHIYCNLTPEEGLVLGTSRNEDSSTVLKFSDFEKVDLVRRYLYSSSQKSFNEEPPEPQNGFTSIYKQLLNLKTKKEVDSKAIVRFLATKLSSRNYGLYSRICKGTAIKASRFECLRGLDEDQINKELMILEKSDRHREDWKSFKDNCQQKRKKTFQKNRTVHICFNDASTKADIKTNDRRIVTDCTCFTFLSADGRRAKALSAREVDLLIFGSNMVIGGRKRKRIIESYSNGEDIEESDNEKESYSNGEDIEESDNEKERSLSPGRELSTVYTSFTSTPAKPIVETSVSPVSVSNTVYNFYTSTPVKSAVDKPSASKQHDKIAEKKSDRTAAVSTFLHSMADYSVVKRAESKESKIEEEEVETKPENLLENASVLLDTAVQSLAKPFFTDDAWDLAKNTLKVLQERFVAGVQKMHDVGSQSKSGKEKDLMGSSSGRRNIYSFSSEDDSTACTVKIFGGKTRKRLLSPKTEDNVTQKEKKEATKEIEKTKNPEIKSENITSKKLKSCRVRITDINSVKDLQSYISKQNVSKD